MAKLLGAERYGNRITRDWLHTDDQGRSAITVETVEDVAPVLKEIERNRERPKPMPIPEGKHVATIPATLVQQAAFINAKRWGLSGEEAYREIVQGKTDRAKRVWETLCYGSEFRKLQY